MAGKRRFGRVRQLPSGRWQARYRGPDGIDRPAVETFRTKADADRWLAKTEDEIIHSEWIDPDAGRTDLVTFATAWVVERPNLSPKTRQLYEGLVRLHIGPTLGKVALADISAARVRNWRANLLASGVGAVTVSKAYRLLKTIMQTASEDRLIRTNPCQIKGAGTEQSPERPTLTVEEVFAVAAGMPDRYRLLVLLATFCSMRWGELAALTRAAVDVDGGVVHIRSAVVELVDGSLVVKGPKTNAGRRSLAIPQSLLPSVREHLAVYVDDAPTALLFAGPKGGPLRRSNFQKHWRSALGSAGVSDVHFHDLRHTGNTLTAQAGATLADLMARMGHASTRAALIYIHTNSKRDHDVAARIDRLLPPASGT